MPTGNRTGKRIRAHKDKQVILGFPASKIGNNFFPINFLLKLSIIPSHFLKKKYNNIYICLRQLKKLLIL